LKDLNTVPSFSFIFRKFYLRNAVQKTSAEPSSAVNNKIPINKWLNLELPHFFNTLCIFWPNSILFQGLQNRFQN